MKLIDFMKNFPDEESCENKLRECRENHGVICPKCGCKEHYWKADKKSFECKHCHYLQNYLNEFCYKFNRRYFGDAMFDRLMVAAISYKNDFKYNIA